MVFPGFLVITAAAALLVSIGSGGRQQIRLGEQQSVPSRFVWNVPPGYLEHFTLAKREGWSIGPVQGAVTISPELYSGITPEQDALARACAEALHFSNRPEDSERRSMERLLTSHPHAFYPEFLLSWWYYQRHDLAHYRQWLEASVRDAPVVLAGRMQYEDGRPIAGYQMELYPQFRLPTSPVSSQTDWLMMPYCVTTDSDGCYWLPTYRAQCVVGGWGSSLEPGSVQYRVEQDYSIEEDPETAWPLVSPTRVGVLPPRIARPYVRVHAPSGVTDRSWPNPILVRGPKLHLSWDPYPGADSYCVSVQEDVIDPEPYTISGRNRTLTPDPLFGEGAHSLQLDLPLTGLDPLMNRAHVYEFYVRAMRGGALVSESRGISIRAVDAVAPVPRTLASLNKVLGPDYLITSIVRRKGEFVITGTCPEKGSDRDYDGLAALFGLGVLAREFQPDGSNPLREHFTERLSTAAEW